MLEKELSFADLPISLSEIYETMGYADAVPDEAVEKEVRGVLGRVEAVTSPRFCFSYPVEIWMKQKICLLSVKLVSV